MDVCVGGRETILACHSCDLAPTSTDIAVMRKIILVVEGNWQDRALLSLMLAGAGYAVLHALNGAEASCVFKRHRSKIAVVILGESGADSEASFVEFVRQADPVLPIFTKSAEPWRSAKRFRETPGHLKPLALMIQIRRAFEEFSPRLSCQSEG